jgi:hypothetical protein
MDGHDLICRIVISSPNQGRKSMIGRHGISPLRESSAKQNAAAPPSGFARGRRSGRSSAWILMRTSAKRRGGHGDPHQRSCSDQAASRKACGGGVSALKPGIGGSSRWGSFDVEVKQTGWADARWCSRAAQWGEWCFDLVWRWASLRARAAMGKNYNGSSTGSFL